MFSAHWDAGKDKVIFIHLESHDIGVLVSFFFIQMHIDSYLSDDAGSV